MTKKLIGVMLLAGSALFAAPHFSIGIGVGAPAYYPPPAVAAVQPPCPGPGYTWVDGYYAQGGGWVAGYWAPPEYYAVPAYRGDRDWDRDRGWNRDRFRDRDRDRGWSHEREEHHEGGRGYG